MKPIELFSNFPQSAALGLKRSKTNARQMIGAKKVPLTKRTARSKQGASSTGWKNNAHVTGNKPVLKASERYPAEFCSALAAVAAQLLEKLD